MQVIGEMIDRLVSIEMRGGFARGISTNLWEAAHEKQGEPLVLNAARRLSEEVDHGDTVIVSAGFVVPPLYPVGEPCGIVGSAALARAFYFNYNKTLFVGEDVVVPVWEDAANAFEQRVVPTDLFHEEPLAISAREFTKDEDEAQQEAEDLIEEYDPAAVITVERPGRNENGIWHTGIGNEMSEFTSKIDYLVEEAKRQDILTVGIGDLANEIGMGMIKDEAEALLDEYEPELGLGTECNCGCGGTIATATETDCLVYGSASNRGAYGLIGMLSALEDDDRMRPSPDQWHRAYEKVVSKRAGDSITGRPVLRDDGVPIQHDMHQIEMIDQIIEAKDFTSPLFEEYRRKTGW